MVIFHCYVSLPEGTSIYPHYPQSHIIYPPLPTSSPTFSSTCLDRRPSSLAAASILSSTSKITLGSCGSCSDGFSMSLHTGWGPQDSVQLPCKWLNAMVYGRYNELVFMEVILVYKPTNITGGPILYLKMMGTTPESSGWNHIFFPHLPGEGL